MLRAPLHAEAEFILLALQGEIEEQTAELEAAAARVSRWDRVVTLAARHRIAPWLLGRLSQAAPGVVPADVLASLRADAWSRTLTSLAMDASLQEALHGLADAGVPAMVLKGPVVAELLYPDPSLRTYDDIDLLIEQQHRGAVEALLTGLGYRLADDHGGAHAPRHGTCEQALEALFVRNEPLGRLDVHFDHLQIGLRPSGLTDIWRRARPWRLHTVEGLAPAVDDLFLTLAVHLHRHGFGRLAWFKDLDLLLRRYGPTMDWPALLRQAETEGVTTSLALCLKRLTGLLQTPLPDAAAPLLKPAPSLVMAGLLWRDSHLFRSNGNTNRWRRAVQFVPWEGARGALPSLLFMGRRWDKLQALWQRIRPGARRGGLPFSRPNGGSTPSQRP